MRKKYKARYGSPFNDQDARTIGLFIEKTFPKGEVTPEALLEKAKPKSSPIHKYFDWDDTIAAEKWRLQQARQAINCLYVELQGKKVRAYENLMVQENKIYKDIETTLTIPELASQVVDRALKEIIFWRDRYQTYEELSIICQAITVTERRFYGKKERGKAKHRNTKTRLKKGTYYNRRHQPFTSQQI